MKKLQLTTLGMALALASSVAVATPQYSGNTTAGAGFELGSDAGYYLWNHEDSRSDWSIRWHGNGADIDPVTWFGDLKFQNSKLDSWEEFGFEAAGTHADFASVLPTATSTILSWNAATNNSGGVDGLDFTLNAGYELMQFSLGSNLFDDLEAELDDPGVESSMIFIGSGYAAPDVLVFKGQNGQRTYQQFEIQVPEPGTLALLGLGLVGLGFARRKH